MVRSSTRAVRSSASTAAIESPTGYNAGYGFAVPINLARSVMDQIVKSGHVERAALGIQVRDASADDAAYVGLKDIRGVLVEDFGDATRRRRKAGVQPGDVIVVGRRQAGRLRGAAPGSRSRSVTRATS